VRVSAAPAFLAAPRFAAKGLNAADDPLAPPPAAAAWSADGLAARAAAFADPGATPIGDGLFALVVLYFAPRLMGPYDDMAARRRKERETGRRVRTRERAEERAAVDARGEREWNARVSRLNIQHQRCEKTGRMQSTSAQSPLQTLRLSERRSRRVHSRSNNSHSHPCSCTLPLSLHPTLRAFGLHSGSSFPSLRLPFESASAGCCCCCCLCSCRCVSDRSFSLHHSTVTRRPPIPFARSARRSAVSAADAHHIATQLHCASLSLASILRAYAVRLV
jgi:hypothetical protein